MTTDSRFTEGMMGLIDYIRRLEDGMRHRITILCRGKEPWEIETHVTNEKIKLKKKRTIK